jgi:hypothetical protein
MTIESLGTIIFEFAKNTTIIYSGLIMIIFAIVISLMVAWRNMKMFAVMLFPASIIPVLIGFKPNIVVLIMFGVIFIISAWNNSDIDIQSLGKGETPVFQNR